METVREEDRGKLTLRLLRMKAGYSGIVLKKAGGVLASIAGHDPTDVWRQLEEAAGQAGKNYVGFSGARARFLRFFPQGFDGLRYQQEERDYKMAAKARLDVAAPLDMAAGGIGFGAAALSAFNDTNLLAPFEKIKVRNLLRGPSADGFVSAAARFTQGEGASALAEMARIARLHDCARWTTITYLPFLWQPGLHMFLKPEVTKAFAERVGHKFVHAYAPALEMPVYSGLLDLVSRTQMEIADLHPRDRIDVQSFIWVVGAYVEADLPPCQEPP